jgi:hypothetical protein
MASRYEGSFIENREKFPEFVYKFRSFRDPFHLRLLSQREVFFATPSSFQDPNECKNVVKYDQLSDQEKFDWIEYKTSIKHPKWNERALLNRANEVAKGSLLYRSDQLLQYQEEFLKSYNAKMGVLSLTGKSGNNQLWTDYADNHEGLNVEFRSISLFESLSPVIGGGIISYVPVLPKMLPKPYNSRDEQMALNVYYKEEHWRPEEEYRLHTFSNSEFVVGSRTKQIPAVCFSRIIVGKNSPYSINDVRSIVCNELLQIDILRVQDKLLLISRQYTHNLANS